MKLASLGLGALPFMATLGSLSAALVGDWNAAGYSGGAWSGTANATVAEGAPAAGQDTTSFPGFSLDYVSFSGGDAFQVASVDNPLAGLPSFTASAVFRTTAAGANGENDFWRNQGIVGIELPGGGVGDWGVGIAAGGLINGGSALHAGDSGSLGPAVNDGAWHVVSMTVADNGNGTHDRRLYLDGVEVAFDLGLAYGGGSSVVANSALFFGDHQPADGGAPNFIGDIARIQLDSSGLSAGEVSALHSTYLGTIPEPSLSALLALAGLLALRRRR